ncbi:MAG: response regulator [Betaproteobacteria bacterium]|nr:response regulator [Betaproteobacteria bacterium]
MTATPLRVLLVDDHTLFRRGLAELLEQDGRVRVVGATGNAAEAFELLAVQPEVVLMDLNMPGESGLEILRRWRAEGIDVPVVALTVSESAEDMAQALRGGARGYLLKSMEPDEVIEALLRAARGEVAVAPAMTGKLLGLLDGGVKQGTLLDRLTEREREILGHLALGKSNKAIAQEVGISLDTVKLHVRNVLAKLNLSSRVEAAVYAVQHDLSGGMPARGKSKS